MLELEGKQELLGSCTQILLALGSYIRNQPVRGSCNQDMQQVLGMLGSCNLGTELALGSCTLDHHTYIHLALGKSRRNLRTHMQGT